MTGQQLKNSILQLAIQGKLVPQNPDDEPASELLQRIRKEKEKLVKEKKIKKEKPLPEISEDEEPFDIPEGWVWCRVGEIIDVRDGTHDSPSYIQNGYPLITSKDFIEGGFDLSKTKYISKEDYISISQRSKVEIGDILFSMIGGNIGNQIDVTKENYFEMAIKNVALYKSYNSNIMSNSYISIYLRAMVSQYQQIAKGGAQPFVSLKILRNSILPLPPLQEQHRIVEKIDELMPLVDEYDKAQKELNTLNANLPEALKKSILQEAIQGKLGTNNPDDEPASELLKRIRAEKEKLIKEKKIKKEKPLPEISEDEKPFEIPDNWVWCRLGDLVSNRAGLAYNKSSLEIKSNSMIRVLRGGNINYGEWVTLDNDVMISSEFVKDDLILKKGMFITPAVTSLECMGKTALIREDQTDIVVGGFVLMFIPTLNDVDLLEYLNLLFQSYYYKLYCQSITNKSGQAFFNISRQKLMECLIPLPPLQKQHRIVEKLNNILPKLKKL